MKVNLKSSSYKKIKFLSPLVLFWFSSFLCVICDQTVLWTGSHIFAIIRSFLFAYGGVCAAKIVHQKLLNSIIHGKFVFFDKTPTGRILNRVSSDLKTVDDDLPFILNIFLAQLFGVVCPIIVCMYAVPWICLVLLPVVFVLYDYQVRY